MGNKWDKLNEKLKDMSDKWDKLNKELDDALEEEFGSEEQETHEETAKRLYEYQSQNPPYTIITPKAKIEGFIEGAKWQAERMYSEEEVIELLKQRSKYFESGAKAFDKLLLKQDLKWFEQHKKK